MKAARLLLLGGLALAGCALLGKNEAVVPRYFTPEGQADPAARPARTDLRLRLGQVTGSSYLRERLVSRSADGELFYSEDLRWSERPEVYLRRGLARTLFEERGVVEVLSGRADTLDVELIAFEELQATHQVRIQARLLLRDDRVGLLAETVTVDQPVAVAPARDRTRALVEAYAQGLRATVDRVADLVVARLGEAPPGPAAVPAR